MLITTTAAIKESQTECALKRKAKGSLLTDVDAEVDAPSKKKSGRSWSVAQDGKETQLLYSDQGWSVGSYEASWSVWLSRKQESQREATANRTTTKQKSCLDCLESIKWDETTEEGGPKCAHLRTDQPYNRLTYCTVYNATFSRQSERLSYYNDMLDQAKYESAYNIIYTMKKENEGLGETPLKS